MDWGHAEALAFGSLLREGIPIRLTGQDTQRGTFSHRHLVFHDAKTGREHRPLAEFGSARFEVHNSPLSEMAVLGFEYGFSVASQRALVLWEAQFGDFANAAQVTVDQFVASGWEKWGQLASLVMLLPHGYEGQGPEHSRTPDSSDFSSSAPKRKHAGRIARAHRRNITTYSGGRPTSGRSGRSW